MTPSGLIGAFVLGALAGIVQRIVHRITERN